MRFRWFVIACGVLLWATSILAQSNGATADPLSGTWTGELVRLNKSTPMPVTLDLKFDGKNAVSGVVSGLPDPADVKTGTFNPKSGALKLQLGKMGESDVLLVLEGTVVATTATGLVSGELSSGSFKIVKKTTGQ